MSVSIDDIKALGAGYLEAHAMEFGQFIGKCVVLYFKNRRHAVRVISEAHDSYVKEFEDVEAFMKGGGDGSST